MTPLLIIDLITKVGLPLASQLIGLYHAGNKEVTASDWAGLVKLGSYVSDDALAAAGIKVVDGKVVNLSGPAQAM